jgi:hypothetical protein
MMAKDPDQRYPNCEAVLADLQAFRHSLSPLPSGDQQGVRAAASAPGELPRRRRWWLPTVVVVALASLPTIFFLLCQDNGSVTDSNREFVRKGISESNRQAPRPSVKKVDFVIGPHTFLPEDSIVIEDVRSELGSMANGDTVIVKGTYTLHSHPTATLLFGVTKISRNRGQGSATTERMIRAGTAQFEWELPITCDGYLHLGLYDEDNSHPFGNVYFGTRAQMQQIAHWHLESPKPTKP